MIFDVITFGSASQDIYLKSKKFLLLSGKEFASGRGIGLNFASKTELDNIFLSSGGGGTNTAATFLNQGLKAAFCGQVGQDYLGNLLVDELKKLKINTRLVLKSKTKMTNASVFLTYPGKDRTILVFRGASDDLEKKDFPWQKIKKAKWFYLSPFSGKLAELTEELVNFAKKNKIKVAWNPGYGQLKFSEKLLKRILAKIDILILNEQEASLLARAPLGREREIFQKIDAMTEGIAIMTRGAKGAVASDGAHLYQVPALPVKLVDGTGAGDAFGSGFVAGIIKKKSLAFALELASVNASFCVTSWGAKKGLLQKNQKWPKIKISTSRL